MAVLGASANPARPSYFVSTYLVSSSCDYEVFFVNPKQNQIGSAVPELWAALADLA